MKIFAHRGASGLAPENTMPAFIKAHELGADGIELDVQSTKDGVIVVIHDERIDRTSDGVGFVMAHDFATLQQHDFGGWFGDEFCGTAIPTLQEVLDWIKPTGMILNIELKAVPMYDRADLCEKTWDMVCRAGLCDRVIISSFDHEALQEMRAMAPEAKLGVLYNSNILQLDQYCNNHRFDCLHSEWMMVNGALVSAWKQAGLEVNVWTVNDREQADRLQAIGVDSIITNYPNCLE